jgi:two-component SAPR family response regulator
VDHPDWVSRKPVRDLLFCLLAHPQGLTKEEIGVIFWPESSSAQLKLRFKNTIYWLRHALGQEVVLYAENRYCFNTSLDYEYDVETFQGALAQAQEAGTPDDQIEAYQQAVRLYQDEYLPATDQNWADQVREGLRLACTEAALSLGQLQLEAQDYQGALESAQRLLARDRCLEAAHRIVMRAYAALGSQAALVRQYETCRQNLLEEIGVTPSKETRQLYETLSR